MRCFSATPAVNLCVYHAEKRPTEQGCSQDMKLFCSQRRLRTYRRNAVCFSIYTIMRRGGDVLSITVPNTQVSEDGSRFFGLFWKETLILAEEHETDLDLESY